MNDFLLAADEDGISWLLSLAYCAAQSFSLISGLGREAVIRPLGGLTRPGVRFTILISHLSTLSLRAYTI